VFAVGFVLIGRSTINDFAFFLGLSTILDIVMTYFFTRPLVILMGRRGASKREGGFSISRGLLAKAQDQEEESEELEVVS
jgi:preprotein translocase subunit SecD